jgi:ATP-dependent Zn protease
MTGSPHLTATVDREVERLIAAADETAAELLARHREPFMRVVAALEQHESISLEELRALVSPAPGGQTAGDVVMSGAAQSTPAAT